MASRLDYIRDWESFAKAANYDPSRVARNCNVSLRQLERFFRLKFGTAPKAWIDQQRLHEAMLLISSGESVKTTAYMLGFKQSSHLSRMFKQHYGMSPRAYVSSRVSDNHDAHK